MSEILCLCVVRLRVCNLPMRSALALGAAESESGDVAACVSFYHCDHSAGALNHQNILSDISVFIEWRCVACGQRVCHFTIVLTALALGAAADALDHRRAKRVEHRLDSHHISFAIRAKKRTKYYVSLMRGT